MEKVRASKGEGYWFIFRTKGGGFVVNYKIEEGSSDDDARFDIGNYFIVEKEALFMARKLRAVLKGADVIEMPSKEDITEKIFSTAGEIVGRDREITVSDCMKTAKSVVGWLIDKIVK